MDQHRRENSRRNVKLTDAYMLKHGYLPPTRSIQINNGDIHTLVPNLFEEHFTKSGIAQVVVFGSAQQQDVSMLDFPCIDASAFGGLQIKLDGIQTEYTFLESDTLSIEYDPNPGYGFMTLELNPTDDEISFTVHRVSPNMFELEISSITMRPPIRHL